MCEFQDGRLGKIDQHSIDEAKESVTWVEATRLARGPAIASNTRGPFQIFGRVFCATAQ